MRESTPWRSAFRRATASAAAERVGRDDLALRGTSSASAIAMHPLPVPTSIDAPAIGMAARGSVDRFLDEDLRFRARNEHVRRDFELEAPELPVADDVGDRLARGAARDERMVAVVEVGGRRDRGPCVSTAARSHAEHVTGEDFGVERRLVGADAGLGERLPGFHEALVERRHQCTVSPS